MNLQEELEALNKKYDELQKLHKHYSSLIKHIEIEMIKVAGQIELIQKLISGDEDEEVQSEGDKN